MKKHHYNVYIMTNANRSVLYIGVTNDLERRVHEHFDGVIKGYLLQRCRMNGSFVSDV